jgi:hypothetical protein
MSRTISKPHALSKPKLKIEKNMDWLVKGLGAIKAKIGHTSDVDKSFSKNKYVTD